MTKFPPTRSNTTILALTLFAMLAVVACSLSTPVPGTVMRDGPEIIETGADFQEVRLRDGTVCVSLYKSSVGVGISCDFRDRK